MSAITHFLLGWTVASMAPSLTKRERTFVRVTGVIPDIAGLGIVAEVLTKHFSQPLNWWSEYHHVLGHKIDSHSSLPQPPCSFPVKSSKPVCSCSSVFTSTCLATSSALAGRMVINGQFPCLLPFSNAWQFTWSGQWPLNGWSNMLITALLIALVLALTWRRGYSPLEMFSGSQLSFCGYIKRAIARPALAGHHGGVK